MSNSRILPTLAEFQKAIQQYRRFDLVHAFGAIGAGALGMLVIFSAIAYYQPPQEDRTLLMVLACMILFGSLGWAAVRSSRYKKQQPLLRCFHCEKFLGEQSGIVIATGNCPHCGQQAIKIPALKENDNPLPPQMTRQEFLAATEKKVAWTKTSLNLSIFGSFAFLFVVIGLYHALDGRNWPLSFQFLPALATAVVVIPWLIWCRWRANRPLPQDALLKCPNCHADLATILVSASGKCQSCRLVVFSDSLDVIAALQENPLS